jgi:Astacin (Peptidase family M12A)
MQELNLERNGCVTNFITIHEFLHAIGFFHMQSAANRDNHVQILWENIQPGLEHNFDKVSDDYATDFGLPYDYQSIMHYPPWAFSINDQPTIVALVRLNINWEVFFFLLLK